MWSRRCSDHAEDHGARGHVRVRADCLGIWSFFVPVIAATGFETVALILVIFLSISGWVGLLFMPNTAAGRSKN